MRIIRIVVLTAAVVVLAAITGCGITSANGGEGKPMSRAPASSDATPVSEPTPAAAKPQPADFTLTVKILSKQCFGDSGCLIDFRIVPAYSGPTLSDNDTWRVLYTVTGDESGPIQNSFTLTGDMASNQSEESASTKSAAVKLVASVTEVLAE